MVLSPSRALGVVAVVFALLIFSTRSLAEEARVYELDELTAAATSHYPGLKASKYGIKAAQAQLNEARISPFTQFTAEGVFSVVPNAEGTLTFSPDGQLPLGNRWGPTVGINVQGAIPLYTFGKIRGARAAARAGIDAAKAQGDQTLARVVYDVRRAYYGMQLALDIEQMIGEGRGKLKKAVTKLKQQVEDDDPDVKQTDVWRLTTALAEIEARASQTTKLKASASAALRLLTGLDPIEVPDCPVSPLKVKAGNVADHVETAKANRPEARMLNAAKAARKAEIKIRKGAYYPDLLLGLQASFSYTPGVTDIENPFIRDSANNRKLAAALIARWSLDFGGKVNKVRRSKAQAAQLQAQTEEALLGMELEVNRAFEDLLDAKRREVAWGKGRKEARSWFITAAQGFQVGTTEPKELVDALKNYFSGRFQHLQAIADHNLAVANLERVTGMALAAPADWRSTCGE